MRILLDIRVAVAALQAAVNARVKLVAIHADLVPRAIGHRLVAWQARQSVCAAAVAAPNPSNNPNVPNRKASASNGVIPGIRTQRKIGFPG